MGVDLNIDKRNQLDVKLISVLFNISPDLIFPNHCERYQLSEELFASRMLKFTPSFLFFVLLDGSYLDFWVCVASWFIFLNCWLNRNGKMSCKSNCKAGKFPLIGNISINQQNLESIHQEVLFPRVTI